MEVQTGTAAERVRAFLDAYGYTRDDIIIPMSAGFDHAPKLAAEDLETLLDEHAAMARRVAELEAHPWIEVKPVASVPCVYFDQPGHTYDQKPALRAYERGPDDWPLCPACAAIVAEAENEATS